MSVPLGTKRPDITLRNLLNNPVKKGSENYQWKGDNANYRSKHVWVQRSFGKPHFCEHCKNSELRHRQYHWANISGKYKRIASDWIRLCAKCHKKFDKKAVENV